MERPRWRRLVGDVFRLFWRLPVSRSIHRRRSAALVALLLSLLLALTACGGSSTGSDAAASESAGGAFPVTVTGDNGDVTLDAAPEAIVSLSPTATEMLFAIDAGDRVVAVDDQSTYPPEAPITDLSGFNPNIEAIAGPRGR